MMESAFSKKKRFLFLKAFFTKWEAQNMPVVAGRLVYIRIERKYIADKDSLKKRQGKSR